jgi:hypothetical protein
LLSVGHRSLQNQVTKKKKKKKKKKIKKKKKKKKKKNTNKQTNTIFCEIRRFSFSFAKYRPMFSAQSP